MSSNDFKDITINNKSVSPIYLDQISFKLPIYTSPRENYRRERTEPKPPKFKLINDPIVNCFADPYIYFNQHHNVIHPLGRFVVLTSGPRIYRDWKGIVQSHAPSKKRRPKIGSIEKFEKYTNSLDENEKKDVCHNFSRDPLNPYIDLLHLTITKLYKAKSVIIKDHVHPAYNTLAISGTCLERLELYLEINIKTIGMEKAKKAFEHILRQWLGFENLSTNKVQFVQISGEKEYLRWEVPQHLISSELSGERPFLIKLYDKNGYIRVEIQANNPFIPNDQFQELDQLFEGWDISNQVQKVATIVAKSLREIEAKAYEIIASLPERPSTEILVDQMIERCLEISPGRADKIKVRKFFGYLATNGSIDVKSAKEMDLDYLTLERFADRVLGFLEKRPRGIGLNSKKGRRNSVYILRIDWLARSGKLTDSKIPANIDQVLSRISKRGAAKLTMTKLEVQTNPLDNARGTASSESKLYSFLIQSAG